MSSAFGEPPLSGVSAPAKAAPASTARSGGQDEAPAPARRRDAEGTSSGTARRRESYAWSRRRPHVARLSARRTRAWRFWTKAATPSTKSPRARHLLLDRRPRARAARSMPRVEPGVELALGAGVGARRARRQAVEQRVDLGLEARRRRPTRLIRPHSSACAARHALAEHRHLGRAREADARGDEDRRAAVGHEPDVHEGQQEVGRLRGDDEVGGQREREPDADARGR